MASRQTQIFENGDRITHLTSNHQSDYALCGQDLAGDSANYEDKGSYTSETTTKKVDCDDCIGVILYCKSVNKTELKY